MQSTHLLTIELWQTEAAVQAMPHYGTRVSRLVDAALSNNPELHYAIHGNNLHVFEQRDEQGTSQHDAPAGVLEAVYDDLNPYLAADGYLWRAVLTHGTVTTNASERALTGSAVTQAEDMLPSVPVVGLFSAPGTGIWSIPRKQANAGALTDLPDGWIMHDFQQSLVRLEICLGWDDDPAELELDEDFFWDGLLDGLVLLRLILRLPADGPMPHQYLGYHHRTRAMIRDGYPSLITWLGAPDPDPRRISSILDLDRHIEERNASALSHLQAQTYWIICLPAPG